MSDSITPYSATFSKKHPDAVSKNVTDTPEGEAAHTWWERLAEWSGHAPGNRRSLKELVAEYPKRAMLVVASATYLNAIAGDVRAALSGMSDPDLLSIVSAGSKNVEGLDEHLIPCDARFQALVNGARRSLNTRVANKILSEARVVPRRSALERKMGELLAKQPEIQRYDRALATDREVQVFIAEQLRQDRTLCHTPLLRSLRDSGRACEQSRFASLYRKVKEQLNGDA